MLSELPTSCTAVCRPLPSFHTSLPFARAQIAVIHPAGSAPLLLAVPCSTTGCSQLFCVQLPDGTTTKIPLDDTGACVIPGIDGHVYLGTATGRLLRFDPQQQTLTALTSPPLGERLTLGHCSPSGKLYFGGDADGTVVEYDPFSDVCVRYFHWRSDLRHGQEARAFITLPDGRIAVFFRGSTHAILLIDPQTGDWERRELSGLTDVGDVHQVAPLDAETLLVATEPDHRLFRLCTRTLEVTTCAAPLPEQDTIYQLHPMTDTVLASGLSGGVYRLDDGRWELLGTPMPGDPLNFTVLPDDRIVGVTYHGRCLQSTIDQRMYTVAALQTRESCGLDIPAMGMSPDRKLYFSFAHNMRLGRWDPDEEEIAECFVAAPFPGEVSALGFAGERLLIGYADACGVMAYYPELPYRLMENPRFIGVAGEEPRRPLGPMVHHESDVYFAAAATSQCGEGAIVRMRPMDNEVQLFPGVIPGQNLTSLIADRLSGMLIAGGRRQPHTPQAAETSAQLAFWSSQAQATVRWVTPFREADSVHVWAAEGGRIYVTDEGTRLVILSSDGEVLDASEFPLGVITSLITNQEGKLYGIAGGWLFHFDAEKRSLARLTEATGTWLTEVRRGRFAYTHAGRIYTVQLW